MSARDIPLHYLHECLIVRRGGVLLWKKRPREHFASKKAWASWNGKHAGTQAGTPSQHGYIRITLKEYRATVLAHRIVWAMTTGAWPSHQIDHRNGVPHDNRRKNLREAKGARQQQQNKARQRNNTTGYTGVSWRLNRNRWQARISIGGKTFCLGDHGTPENASQAYLAAKRIHHPFQPVPRKEVCVRMEKG